MEVGRRIRELRRAAGMSQDDLATRVYVSRQTISSWENAKTYPDIQSLLLLSEIFDATVDSLIKGDVETMTATISNDARTLHRLGFAMAGFLTLAVAAVIWMSVQVIIYDWTIHQALPTFLLSLVLWGVAMFSACWAERLKREHDLVTYSEVVAFWEGREPNRDTERGRRERALPAWMKSLRTAGMVVLAAAAGFLCSRYGLPLLEALFR